MSEKLRQGLSPTAMGGSHWGAASGSDQTSRLLDPLTPAEDIPPLPLERADRAAREHNDRRLIVGSDISLKGRIDNCDTLIVEGKVEAALQVDALTVAAGGCFTGQAKANTAMVSGVVDGNLEVYGRLEISGTGRVTGRVRYGQIVIQEGGRLSGDIGFRSIEDSLREIDRASA